MGVQFAMLWPLRHKVRGNLLFMSDEAFFLGLFLERKNKTCIFAAVNLLPTQNVKFNKRQKSRENKPKRKGEVKAPAAAITNYKLQITVNRNA